MIKINNTIWRIRDQLMKNDHNIKSKMVAQLFSGFTKGKFDSFKKCRPPFLGRASRFMTSGNQEVVQKKPSVRRRYRKHESSYSVLI